jgi:hypothetical protein
LLVSILCLALAACGEEQAAVNNPVAAPVPGVPGNTAPNSPPTIAGTPVAEIEAGSTYDFLPVAADADGDVLTFSATGVPAWAALDPNTGRLIGTPADADVGESADIMISVSDGEATATLPAFRIMVNAVPVVTPPPTPTNVAPRISGTPATSVQATSAYSFTPSASDADSPTLTFSIASKPSWAAFSTTTGRLSGTPASSNVGTYSNIRITVSDGALSASLPAFAIAVTAAPNRAPTISGTPAASVVAGVAYTFTPIAADPDGQVLAYSIANKPSWAVFSTTNGRLSGTPASTNVGAYSNIRITVSDGSLSASLAAFTLTVNAASNTAPTISGAPGTSVVAGSAYSFTPTARDADGDALAFSVSGKPAWAIFSTATGALTGTPTTAQAGSYPGIVISVSDGKAAAVALAAFTLTVTQPQSATGSATLNWTAPTQNTDGSALTDLSGFHVHHGLSAANLTDVTDIPGATITSYVATQLASGTHYFAVSAYTSGGMESAMSAVGSKTIP